MSRENPITGGRDKNVRGALRDRRAIKTNQEMKNQKLRPWKTLGKKVIFKHGKFLTVEEHHIALPDGDTIPDWSWVIIPDSVIILVRSENGKFLMFDQTKYALDGTSYAPVGGMLEPGEKPLAGAKRELLEELGMKAKRWIDLGEYTLDANRHVAVTHLYLALDARVHAAPDSDDLEDQQLLELDLQDLAKAVQDGRFKVLAWIAVVSLALEYLSRIDAGD